MTGINRTTLAVAVCTAFLSACITGPDDPEEVVGLDILGGGRHSADSVDIEEMLGSGDLDTPMDLAFHPTNAGELWIVNLGDSSMTIVSDVDASSWSTQSEHDSSSDHFMVHPAGLAFGTDGMMATIHEEDETTPLTGGASGTFMGPTMWTSSASQFDAGHNSHYDMLHNSPNGMGIAWETENVYWVFDGFHESLTRYNFGDDHGGGGTDHSDADVLRYVEGDVSYEAGVASHLVFDSDSELLYVADAGNGRVAVLDTTSGSIGSAYGPNYDGGRQRRVSSADLWTFADDDAGLEMPSGIALHDDLLFVVDHATSTIWAFDLEGEVVDYLETGIDGGSLMGIDFDADGRLYLVDAADERVMRISTL
jgi:sugar lactone lactonase YvrE